MRYQPKYCLDITIEIEKIIEVGLTYFVANLSYFNRNWKNGNFLIAIENNVRVPLKAFSKWKVLV